MKWKAFIVPAQGARGGLEVDLQDQSCRQSLYRDGGKSQEADAR
jgi:hypothetical protein